MKNHLDVIEARLRQVIESWTIPFSRGDFQHRLAHQVVEAMRQKIYASEDGSPIAPHQFTIRLNPVIVHEMQGSSVLESFPEVLRQASFAAGVQFLNPPELKLEPDARLSLEDIVVQAQGSHLTPGNTAILKLPPQTKDLPGRKLDGSSFLILGGDQIYPLRLAVVNLGRRPDNHLVIEDARISRVHAQIRFTRGQFVLFDLNSTGGTSANGQRIRQHTLKPGDVISLAGVTLIYGEEPMPGEGDSDTTQILPSAPPPPEELQ
jgi:hypothetical protein